MVWQSTPDATTRRAIRRLFAAYLSIAGIALAFPYRPAAWLPLALLHAFGIIVLLRMPYPIVLAWLQARWPRVLRFVGDWYALMLIPALYAELAVLNRAVFNGRYFDPLVLGWEQAVFGGQPSRELAQAWPVLPLSELLHFSYISYYLIIYGPPIYLYLKGRRTEHQQVVFTLMLAFLVHYVFFIYFPVQGPRYLFPPPAAGNISSGFFYNLAHRILEAGSSQGAAFPSSHVGVSFAQAALAFQLMPRIAPAILLLSSGLALGAVYGGFHYATDAVCGLLLGVLLFAIAPHAARGLAGNSRQ
jgi:membrane-associated phospholipid phosphatase